MMTPEQQEAYDVGYNAGYNDGYNDDGTQCPYPDDSDEHNYWLSGYNEALDGYSRSFDL